MLESQPHRVVVLLLAPVIGFDATIPPMTFGAAVDDHGRTLYDVRLCSIDGQPVASTHGYTIGVHGDLRLLDEADTVIVPGTRHHTVRRDGELPADVVTALERRSPETRFASICTGAFALAAAGVFDGRPATTHWQAAREFAAMFPAVAVDEKVLFVDDGDVLSSAGLSAGIDLCLHMIRRDHGSRVANQVARYAVVPPWRDGGQAQFIERPVPDDVGQSTTPLRQWLSDNLAEPMTVTQMARRAHMSERTFARRFRAETGESPGDWLAAQRINAALAFLESTDLAVDIIAARVGLGTGTNLRAHLRRAVGVAPLEYRRRFRGSVEAS
ncbi:putative AraC family transcriptional regulator [Gordonia effusa NBRC 100432]|uniref:Putative AraC family transcriptional regulator n=1 Tax=Gordonia effusa NBRC 100432 TaxID=1077974 RepID=H0R061_9ACTN|nr:helix-turn-helix domain-containing protein [Gordonia effusa]GAB18462.1 putative AraC family transcriptional regulator [Gordonia effusa NBRC 100432]